MPTYLGMKDGTYKSTESLEKKNNNFSARVQEESATYYILSDNVNQNDMVIKATSPLPYLRQILTKDDLQLQCTKKDAAEISTVIHPMTGVMCILWEVTITYTTDVLDVDGNGGSGSSGDPNSPLEQIPTIAWGTRTYQQRMEKDVNGVMLQTKNNEPIFYEQTLHFTAFTITKYGLHPFDKTIIDALVDRRNLTPFYGYPEGCVLCEDLRADPEIVNGTVYTKETYTFTVDYNDVREFLHQGFKIRKVANGEIITDRDDQGDPQGPRNLDADGVPFVDQTNTHFLTFQVDNREEFNKYNLGPF